MKLDIYTPQLSLILGASFPDQDQVTKSEFSALISQVIVVGQTHSPLSDHMEIKIRVCNIRKEHVNRACPANFTIAAIIWKSVLSDCHGGRLLW